MHRTNVSVLSELQILQNLFYNFVVNQKLKYFGHMKRYNWKFMILRGGGAVAGERNRGKPGQRWEDVTDFFRTVRKMILQKDLSSNILNRTCKLKKNCGYVICPRPYRPDHLRRQLDQAQVQSISVPVSASATRFS